MGWQHWIDGQRKLHPDWPDGKIRALVEEWWPGLREEDRLRPLNGVDVQRWLRKAGCGEQLATQLEMFAGEEAMV